MTTKWFRWSSDVK